MATRPLPDLEMMETVISLTMISRAAIFKTNLVIERQLPCNQSFLIIWIAATKNALISANIMANFSLRENFPSIPPLYHAEQSCIRHIFCLHLPRAQRLFPCLHRFLSFLRMICLQWGMGTPYYWPQSNWIQPYFLSLCLPFFLLHFLHHPTCQLPHWQLCIMCRSFRIQFKKCCHTFSCIYVRYILQAPSKDGHTSTSGLIGISW